MSSAGRKLAKNFGKSLRKKLDSDSQSQNDELQQRLTELNSSSSTNFSGLEMKSSNIASASSIGKSTSLSTIASEPGDPITVDHKEIIALTHDVKNFSDTLAKLKILFIEGLEPGDDARVLSHECLGEVLAVLKSTLQHYSALQSPEIFTTAKALITKIKSHNYEEEMDEEDLQLFLDAIDQLALSFSRSVSEYLMGDIVMQQQEAYSNKTKSCDNIVKAMQEEERTGSHQDVKKSLSPEELDAVMAGIETGLDLALQRAKAWSRYARDIISYIDKKSQLELEYAKNLSRIAHSMQPVLTTEGFLPLQSVFCTALSQDAEFATNLQTTQALLHTSKFVEPLASRRNEHDRVRKAVKETWDREVRKMQDAVSNLRKAQGLYISRQQEYERMREASLKSDGDKQEKRKKLEEEAMHKAAEAETTYKACVAEANYRQRTLEKTKAELLAKIREQIQMCDQVIKSVTVEYFQLLHTVWSPVPVQYQTLSESSKCYETGCQYAEFIKRLPASTSQPCRTEEFMFVPYLQGQKQAEGRKTSVHSNGSYGDHSHSNEGSPVSSPRRDKYRSPVRAWGQTVGQTMQQVTGSDTDSVSGSSKSHDSSPSSSPHDMLRRQIVSSQSFDELNEDDLDKTQAQEKRAQMKRTMTVSGEDALELPLMSQRGRRNTTFGVDFQEQVDRYKTQVPPIITQCLAEIERRGVMIKGIYRVSGVKSKVETLCQRFDLNPDLVELEEVHPNIISNVLKLYLRQLPEPLLTFRLYSDFIHLAKENMSGSLTGEKLVINLTSLVHRLPPSNFKTCAVLMHHLHRVAAHSDLNQMSSSNLGIVFGPTLLRPLEGTASLASLVDTPHQTRAIELLISHAKAVFGPGEDYQVLPDETPVEVMEDSSDSFSIGIPSSSIETSPEKSPTKESIGMFAAPVLRTSGAASNSTPSFSVSKDDKLLLLTDGDYMPTLEPSAADFTLPGSASQDKYDSVFVEKHSSSLADAFISGQELSSDSDGASMSTLDDDDFADILLPDRSQLPNSKAHAPLLTPHFIAGGKTSLSESVLSKQALGMKESSSPSSFTALPYLSETDPSLETTISSKFTPTVVDSATWPGPAGRAMTCGTASSALSSQIATVASTISVSDGRVSPTKGDVRAERFKLEQRKLVSAIKSDPKVGIVAGDGESLKAVGVRSIAEVNSSHTDVPVDQIVEPAVPSVNVMKMTSVIIEIGKSADKVSIKEVNAIDEQGERKEVDPKALEAKLETDHAFREQGEENNADTFFEETKGEAARTFKELEGFKGDINTLETKTETVNTFKELKGSTEGDIKTMETKIEAVRTVKELKGIIEGDIQSLEFKTETVNTFKEFKESTENDIKTLETKTGESTCKKIEKKDVILKSFLPPEMLGQSDTKIESGISARLESTSVRSKGAVSSTGKMRISSANIAQRRNNTSILSASSNSGSTIVAPWTSRGALVRSSPVSGTAPAVARRTGSSCAAIASSSGSSSVSGASSGSRHLISSNPSRHSFESSLRSYTASTTAPLVASDGMPFVSVGGVTKHGSLLEKSHGNIKGTFLAPLPKVSPSASVSSTGSTTKALPFSSGAVRTSPLKTASFSGFTARSTTSSAPKSTVANSSASVAVTSAAGTTRKFHDKCIDHKTGEGSTQHSSAKSLSQDRTPRFV